MDDKTITTVVTGLLQLPAYAFLLWLWLEQTKAHKQAVDSYRKEVQELRQQLIDCYRSDKDERSSAEPS